MTTIYPIIMCGGAGSRLWPVSRQETPKQFHRLQSEKSLLQETMLRVKGTKTVNVASSSIVSAKAHQNILAEQCAEIGIEPLYTIFEPMGRNTAPVAAIVSEVIHKNDPDGLILLLPADHYIENVEEFWRCVEYGISAASSGQLVTLGIQPTCPETGYGYIRVGEKIEPSVFKVDSFVEKPNLETAQSYLSTGQYFWNAGIFLFSPATMLENFLAYAPDILESCRATISASQKTGSKLVLDENSFGECPSDSIDFAIMEKSDNIVVIAPVDVGWSDVGCWTSVAEMSEEPSQAPDNTKVGDVVSIECKNSYFRSDGPMIAGIGLEDMIVVATDDAVVIVPKDRAQDVKKIVEQLKSTGRTDLL